MATFDVRRLPELYAPDPARLAAAQARQAAVWRGERPDRWPILFTGSITPAQEAIPNAGIRLCEDSTAIVGPAAIEAFALPYTRRLAQRFGGAWVHYCGRNDALTAAALDFWYAPG